MISHTQRIKKFDIHKHQMSLWLILFLFLFLIGCGSFSPYNQSNLTKLPASPNKSHGRIYDCAANSLYALCTNANIQISYEECLELLPFTPQGNNMLELKGALIYLGFKVEAQRLTVDELSQVRVPAIILAEPKSQNEGFVSTTYSGHFFVLLPMDNKTIKLIDYPRDPVILFIDDWISHLHNIGVENAPILLCGKPSQRLEDMIMSLQDSD
jgi:hypothetical protein